MHWIILLLRDKNQEKRKGMVIYVVIMMFGGFLWGGRDVGLLGVFFVVVLVFCFLFFAKVVTFSIGPVGTQHRIGPQTVSKFINHNFSIICMHLKSVNALHVTSCESYGRHTCFDSSSHF